MKRKILAALLLVFIAIVLALGITHFSFREMMSTIRQLSSPNEKLAKLNAVFEEITMLDQQQRAEAIQNPQKPYKYFLDQTGYIHSLIDSLQTLEWDSIQKKRLKALPGILDQRDQIFVSYLKVRADLADNKEFSHQLDTLANLLKDSQRNGDSSVVTTEKKIITTYLPDTVKNIKDDRTFFKKLFSRKKNKTQESAPVRVQEELQVTVDTLALAKRAIDIGEIEKRMHNLETDQLSQRKKLQKKELELIHANSLFVNQLLNTLHEVENEELMHIRGNNEHAAHVVTRGISRMTILMVSFFIAAAFLVYLILIDISKSNFYKTQLEKAKNEAEELSKIKQRFLANMSHEIRTPLQSIIGFTEQLNQDAGGNAEAVKAIHSSSEHLLHIVNEVLDYSRISSGNLTFAKEKFKLLTVVKEVEAAMRIQAEQKALSFITDIEKATDYTLLGDAFRLRQILYNLLGNAIKFTEKGFIKLTVKTAEKETSSIKCTFEISDTGIGIYEDDLNKIFNQFEQANYNITKQYGGTGLGLTIVKSLIDAQDGTLNVKSEPGAGSIFGVTLAFEKSTGHLNQEIKNKSVRQIPFKGKVIILDDDAMILKLCSLILEKNNISHITFNEPEDLLYKPADLSVSHIFLDIRMPSISGVDLCHVLKDKYPSHTRFIALTAHVLPEEKKNLLNEGFHEVLTKPFHESELMQVLGATSQVEKLVAEVPDFAIIRQMTLGDEALFQSVMVQFVEETTNDLRTLKDSLAQYDKKIVREIVHKMAGRLGQMGVYSISSRLHDIEVSIAEGNPIAELAPAIQQVMKEVLELINNIRLTTIAHLN